MIAGVPNPMASLVFQPVSIGWLGMVVILVGTSALAVAYLLGLRWRNQTLSARVVLLVLRVGAMVCLVLALLHPAWVTERTEYQRPLVAVVLDDSESMSCPIPSEEHPQDEGLSRYTKAVEVLRKQIIPALQNTHRVRLFDIEAREFDFDDLPPLPTSSHSPLTDTLLRVQQDLRDQLPVSIVLLSDGAETTDGPAAGGPEQLRVPVHPVGIVPAVAERVGPPDLTIRAVAANREAMVGNTVRVAVDITGRGNEVDVREDGARQAVRVPVKIMNGDRAVARRTISWRPSEPAVRAELDFVPRRQGRFTYTVQLGSLPGEVNLGDNRATFALTVRAKPLTVLYVDGVLRWEGKFVRQALEADPDINLISSVRTVRPGSDRGSQGLLLAEQLANIDVVILGDVEATYFARDELQALCSWITESGGALVLTGGYRSFGPEGFGRTGLREILPVVFSAEANPQIERPFGFKLTEAGQESPVFHLTGDRVRDTAFFQSLPALTGCSRIAALKPAAQVLAVNPQIAGPDGSQGLPIMVVQQVGSGRTMTFAVDTTWRWRMVVGGFAGDSSFYPRFWGQLVRYMASEPDPISEQLFVSTDRYRYRLGHSIELNVALQHASERPVTSRPDGDDTPSRKAVRWRVMAQAVDERGGRVDIPLAELSPSKYRGTLAAARPGRLDMVVSAVPVTSRSRGMDDQDVMAQSQVITVQVERPDLEMIRSRPDPQWLARVAQLTAGRVIDTEQIESWAEQLSKEPIELHHAQSVSLWRHPLLAGTFFALLCAEWILRRWRRMP